MKEQYHGSWSILSLFRRQIKIVPECWGKKRREKETKKATNDYRIDFSSVELLVLWVLLGAIDILAIFCVGETNQVAVAAVLKIVRSI